MGGAKYIYKSAPSASGPAAPIVDQLLQLGERLSLASIGPICQCVTQSIIETFKKQLLVCANHSFRRHFPPLTTFQFSFVKISTFLHNVAPPPGQNSCFQGESFCCSQLCQFAPLLEEKASKPDWLWRHLGIHLATCHAMDLRENIARGTTDPG